MKINDKPCITLPDSMDAECIGLCTLLNRLPGVETYESCCGHLQNPYWVFFNCNDLRTVTRLGRAVSKNYSDGKWEIVVDSCDTHPSNCFWLRSKTLFEDFTSMMLSVNSLMDNIVYWFKDEFDKHFDGETKIIEPNEEETEEFEPFDLERAKAGEPVFMRNGTPVRIVCYDKKDINGENELVVLSPIDDSASEIGSVYDLDGKEHCGFENTDTDLVMKKHKPKKCWVNVYGTKSNPHLGRVLNCTKEDAIKIGQASIIPGDYWKTVQIEI